MLEVASRACHVSRRPRTSVADDDLFYVRSRGPFSWLSLVCFEQGAIVASKTVSRLLSRGHSNSFNATAESLRTPSPLTFRSVSVAKTLKQLPMHSLKTRRAFFFQISVVILNWHTKVFDPFIARIRHGNASVNILEIQKLHHLTLTTGL